jgi:Tol biopolymer transport system component
MIRIALVLRTMSRLGRWGAAVALAALTLAAAASSATDRRAASDYPDVEIETVGLGGHITNLTRNPGLDTSPAVSRDGMRIAFVSSRDGQADLYTMKTDGTDVRRVTTSPFTIVASDPQEVAWNDAGHTIVSWSPDGKQLAFDAQNATFSPDCFHNCVIPEVLTVHSDGTGLQLVADDAGTPAWSADGRRVAYRDAITPFQDSDTLTISTVASGAVVHLKANGFYDFYDPPAWSKGGLLAFDALTGDARPFTVRVARADGGGQRKLGLGSTPVWSSDGRRLAFVRSSRVYTIAANGGRVTRRSGKETASGPAWSPDGKRIAYLATTGKPPLTQIAVVPAAGGKPRMLTHLKAGSAFDARLTWTAHSKKVVFALFHTKP